MFFIRDVEINNQHSKEYTLAFFISLYFQISIQNTKLVAFLFFILFLFSLLFSVFDFICTLLLFLFIFALILRHASASSTPPLPPYLSTSSPLLSHHPPSPSGARLCKRRWESSSCLHLSFQAFWLPVWRVWQVFLKLSWFYSLSLAHKTQLSPSHNFLLIFPFLNK